MDNIDNPLDLQFISFQQSAKVEFIDKYSD